MIIIINLDKRELQAIVILKRTEEFRIFVDVLTKSRDATALVSATQKDEVMSRWNQGKVQELLDILNKIKNADEDLKAINNKPEARKHIE